eukprot:TRINITY_DN3310_c0_g1_i1.p1 TRINITY_DN3310_c0_g1~~TRINITY_DN3310_c0_g1_i1.p1  ORF type:complete len:460 (+),score=162.60 TRINITY_DN3310_c0_g1_i1:78-1457(+)
MTEEKSKEAAPSKVIVIDAGTGLLKIGFAGEDAPQFVIPTLLYDSHGQALPASLLDATSSSIPSTSSSSSSSSSISSSADNEYLVGLDALDALRTSDTASVVNPVERGEIRDLDAFQKFLEIVCQKNKINLSEYPVLFTSTPSATKLSRTELAARLFKKFKVPALCICNQAVLSLFASGRTTGLVVESGEGVTHAVPVYEGFPLNHAVLRLPLAGKDLTKHLMQILSQKASDSIKTESQLAVVRDIKEKLCLVKCFEKKDSSWSEEKEKEKEKEMTEPYELPDGKIIQIDNQCRYQPSEILFKPRLFFGGEKEKEREREREREREKETSIIISNSSSSSTSSSSSSSNSNNNTLFGIQEMVYESMQMCDVSLRRDLVKNVVLAGGTSMLKGFGERMKSELDALFTDQKETTTVIQDSQRKYAAWIGGSMFASLSTFDQIKINKAEFEEDDKVILKKHVL